MKHADLIQKCQRLEATLDRHLFKVYRDENGQFVDDSGAPVTTADKIKAGAAATAIGGGGAIVGVRALKKRYGADMAADPQKSGQALLRGVGRDVSNAAGAVNQAVAPAVQSAGQAVAAQATGAINKLKKSGLLNRAGNLLRGVTRFDARAKIIELAAK